jgi:hypothetical protein
LRKADSSVLPTPKLKSPCMATASSKSLCMLASLSSPWTAQKIPLLKSVHQNTPDSRYMSANADTAAMPMVADFWGIDRPGREGEKVERA